MQRESERTQRVRWGKGRMAFHANRSRIEKLLSDKASLILIYEELQDSLAGLSYNQFTYHIRHEFPQFKKTKANATPPQSVASSLDPIEAPRKVIGDKPRKFIPGPRNPDPKDLY